MLMLVRPKSQPITGPPSLSLLPMMIKFSYTETEKERERERKREQPAREIFSFRLSILILVILEYRLVAENTFKRGRDGLLITV